jgi:acyl-CoA thioester hydrolase
MKSFKSKQRVLYADTDSHAVVHFGSYLRWVEKARTSFFRECIGKSLRDFEKEDLAFPFIEVKVNYLIPARYDDLLDIKTTITDVGNTSLRFSFEVSKDKEIKARIEAVCVCVDLKFKKNKVPDDIRKKCHPR